MRHFAVAFLLCLCAGPLAAQEPTAKRLDPWGDSLPDGAIARLGTARLVHPHLLSVAISPDGKFLASGARSGELGPAKAIKLDANRKVPREPSTIRIWESATGKLVLDITAPDSPVMAMTFSADGKVLFADCQSLLVAWEAHTGKPIWKQEIAVFADKNRPYDNSYTTLQLLTSKDRLYSLHQGRRTLSAAGVPAGPMALRIHKMATGQPIPLPDALTSATPSTPVVARFLHDIAIDESVSRAAILVSKSSGNEPGFPQQPRMEFSESRLEVVDLPSGKVLHRFDDPQGTFRQVAIAPNGSAIAVAGGKNVWLFEGDKGQTALPATFKTNVEKLVFLGNDTLVAIPRLGGGGPIAWDVRTHAVGAKPAIKLADLKTIKHAKFDVDLGASAISLSEAGTGKPLLSLPHHRDTPDVRFERHSPGTIVSRDLKQLIRWDAKSGKSLDIVPLTLARTASVSLEKQLAIKPVKGAFELSELSTNKSILALEKSSPATGTVRFSALGNRAAIARQGSYSLHDVATGKLLSTIKLGDKAGAKKAGATPMPRGIFELSTAGKLIALRDDSEVEPTNSTIVGPFPDNLGSTAPDHVDLYDVDTGKHLRRLVVPGDKLKARSARRLRFSDDESILVADVGKVSNVISTKDERSVAIVVWEVSSGRVLSQFKMAAQPTKVVSPLSPLGEFALSPDNRTLALGMSDRPGAAHAVEVWDVGSGTKRGEYRGHAGDIADLDFSADGTMLASGSRDTTILIWDTNRPFQPPASKETLDGVDLQAHWTMLGQPDAAAADAAIWSLVRAPKDSVPFLKGKLKRAAAPDAVTVKKLLDSLDGEFKVRSSAVQELMAMKDAILDDLEAAAKRDNSLEKRRSLAKLIENAHAASPFGTADRLREWRAVEVLERIGNAPARDILRELAAGAASSPLTQAAKASVSRLK